MITVRRGDGHPTWGAVWIDIGRLRLIRCAPGHLNNWMIVWRRRLPEFDRDSYERLKAARAMSPEQLRALDEAYAQEARETRMREQRERELTSRPALSRLGAPVRPLHPLHE
jgi:hypothetical protein